MMPTLLDYDALHEYVTRQVIDPYYSKRIETLRLLSLINNRGRQKALLNRKNPYLFRAKNIQTSGEFVQYALDGFLSSSEETLFGNLLEGLAIHICEQVFGGHKAPAREMKSVDLIFTRDETRFIVGIKSGPNWGNQDQKDRMASNFKIARAILRDKGETLPIVAVNGCMYGVDQYPWKPNSHDPELSYYKYCGQLFWEFISGDEMLYLRLIRPLGEEARTRSDAFNKLYHAKINEMTTEFSNNFLGEDNQIDWNKLIHFVSSSPKRMAD